MADPTPAGARSPQATPLPARERVVAPLPVPLTGFIGRGRDIDVVTDLVQQRDTPLVTLTGPGGVGKTRLAVEVGRRLATSSGVEVAFVSLAPVRDPALVVPTVAHTLGAHAPGGRSPDDALVDLLEGRRLLLILDNVEQVIDAAPRLARLLRECPELTVLVTSRVPLHLDGEQRYPVAPLTLPDPGDPPAHLMETEAVRLFVARGRAVDPAFTISSDNAAAIASICRRLDGLPLALVLAASKVAVLPPRAMLPRLSSTLPLLTGGSRDTHAHQQTVRDTIVWSYELLEENERELLRHLSVFSGGFTLEAAESVAGGGDVLGGVLSLVEQSLLYRYPGAGDEPRFGMLETVREFGLEQLATSGEDTAVRDRHAVWCLELAEAAGEAIWQREDPDAVARLDAEIDNIRVALAWLDQAGSREALLRMMAALGFFFYLSGRASEGHGWAENALSGSADDALPARVRALNWAGLLASDVGNSEAAFARYEQAAYLARTLALPDDEAISANGRGYLLEDQGDYDGAEAYFLAAREHFQQTGHMFVTHQTYHLGIVAYGRGQLAEAKRWWDTAREEARAHGKPVVATWCRELLGLVAAEQRELGQAAAALRECLGLSRHAAYQNSRGNLLGSLAVLATACGLDEAAARLLGAAVAAHGRAFDPPEGLAYERAGTRARAALGTEAYERAWATGQKLRREQIDADAHAVLAEATAADERATGPTPHGLTPREMEVLRQMATGRTDQQIADALFMSRRTAEWHVRNVLGKLGVANRAEAAALAIRDGLL